MQVNVAVFPRRPVIDRDMTQPSSYTAYTRDYNLRWDGCCLHTVEVKTRPEAKRVAIMAHILGQGCHSDGRTDRG